MISGSLFLVIGLVLTFGAGCESGSPAVMGPAGGSSTGSGGSTGGGGIIALPSSLGGGGRTGSGGSLGSGGTSSSGTEDYKALRAEAESLCAASCATAATLSCNHKDECKGICVEFFNDTWSCRSLFMAFLRCMAKLSAGDLDCRSYGWALPKADGLCSQERTALEDCFGAKLD